MKNKLIKKGIVVVFAVLLIVGILYNFFFNNVEKVGKSNRKDITIHLKENIYISARYWGLTGDHQEIVLSCTPINPKHKSYSKDNDYIFYLDEIFYKKVNNHLIIYTIKNLVSVPKDFKCDVQISLNEINDDILNNYKMYGLEKISVYDK